MTKYDTKELFEKAKKLVKKNKLFWIEDIIAFLPISKETFYRYTLLIVTNMTS